MLKKVIQFLLKKFSGKEYLSHIKFRPDIKALAMETYKGVDIFYLAKPNTDPTKDPEGYQPIYHCFYKKQFYFGEADTLEELETLAHADIDDKFRSKKYE